MRLFFLLFVFPLILGMLSFYVGGALIGALLCNSICAGTVYALFITNSLLAIGGGYLRVKMSNRRPIDRPRWVNNLIEISSIWFLVLFLLSVFLLGQFLIGGVLGWWIVVPVFYSNLITIAVFMIAFILWLALVYGVIYGKYRFKVEEVDLTFPNLPESFDGFRIVQISDVHSGTWDDLREVQRGIAMIQEQAGDLIVFTGDLVNRDKNEIDPFVNMFAGLKAPYGKYAILGNHDYYGQPRESALRPKYYQDFFRKYEAMGWDLLRNEHRIIKKGKDQIILAGVENWGLGKYFPKRGDLNIALKGTESDDFCVMLSHDPTHWKEHILSFAQEIHLTLSGHTHGMQFGVNTNWLKWSPIKWRYQNWIGLYREGRRSLYVNRGFGVLGFSGRVGMWPEITVLTLRKTKGHNSL